MNYSPNVIWDVVDGKTVLCDKVSANMFELDETGTVIWYWSDGATAELVVKKVQMHYSAADPDVVEEQTLGFLKNLTDAGLLDLADAAD